MNGADLLGLKLGQVTFDDHVRKHGDYVRRLATWFHRRTSWVRMPIDLDDLMQIGLVEMWQAVGEYRWRCQRCPRSAECVEAFEIHSRRHGVKPMPRPTILKYVHARVGRSMDHELRRHVRRNKYHVDELFEYAEPASGPTQEAVAELSLLVAAARRELDPVRQQVLAGMAFGVPRHAHGVSPRRVTKLRDELRDDFLAVRSAC